MFFVKKGDKFFCGRTKNCLRFRTQKLNFCPPFFGRSHFIVFAKIESVIKNRFRNH